MHKKLNGLPVVDAKQKLVLTIEPSDVRWGSRGRQHRCAAAQACSRLDGVTEARVHLSRIFLKIGKKKWERYVTPGALRSEIISFDRGGKFETGDYVLLPIPKAHQTDRHKKKFKDRKVKRGNGKKRTYHTIKGVRTNGHIDLA